MVATNLSQISRGAARARIGDSALASRLQRELEGEVLFDAFSRGRYSTDASIYQIEPIGVVVPRHRQDLLCTLQIAADAVRIHDLTIITKSGIERPCKEYSDRF